MRSILTACFAFLLGNVLFAQTIPTPTQTDQIITDPNGNSKADPGDRIRYKVTVQNTGAGNATGTKLNAVPDPRTTLDLASFRTSPLAMPDAYDCYGNVGIAVADGASDLLGNDHDDAPAGLTATAGTFATTQGGSITIAANGSFSYNPPRGYEGTDTYQYTLNDGNAVAGVTATDMGTVTITVSGMIWFINNNAGACPSSCDGRPSNPYPSLAAFNTANDGVGLNPADNDVIFIYANATAYTGGIVLRNGQKLFGQDMSVSLASAAAITLPSHSNALPTTNGAAAPDVSITNSGGDGVTLADGNTLRGFSVGNCSDFGIENSGTTSVGNLVASEVAINNGTGGGFDASHGSGASTNAVFTAISSSGGTNGINLTTCAGTFTVNGGTITNPSGTGVLISGGSVVFSSSGAISDNSGFAVDINNHDSGNATFSGNITSTASGIRVQNCSGSTKTFSGSSKSLSTGASTAVTLSSNTGSTVSFTNGGLAITTTSGTGFNATGGGTVNVTGTGNTIASTTGTALNVVSTTIGASNLNFQSIAKNGGTNGIVLNNTGSSGGLTVTGTGAADSGGTIQNTTGSAILATSTQDLSLTRIKILAPGNHGIEAADLRGTCLLANSTIMDWAFATGNGCQIINNNVNLAALTISTSTFNDTATSNTGVRMEVQGSSNMTLSVESNCLFTDMFGDGVQVSTITGASGTVSVTVKNSTFNNAAAVGNGGIGIYPFGGPVNFTFDIDGNTFDDIMRPITNLGAINITDGDLDGGGPTVTGMVRNNVLKNIVGSRGIVLIADTFAGPLDLTVDNNSIDRLGSTSKHAINVGVRDNVAGAKVKIINNDIGQNPSPAAPGTLWTAGNGTAEAILVLTQNAASANVLLNGNVIDANATLEVMRVRAIGTSTMNATVTSNYLNDTNTTHIEFAAVTASGTPTMCVNISGNILPAAGVGVIQLTESAGTMNVTQASAAVVAAANSGATVTVTNVPTFGQPACTTPN